MGPKEELKRWGFEPNGCCHCGCGERTGAYFAPGHDPRFAASLMRTLEGNPELSEAVRNAIRKLRDKCTS